MTNASDLTPLLTRIADALERLAPPKEAAPDFSSAPAFVWQSEAKRFLAVKEPAALEMKLLQGIDRNKKTLLANTRNFASEKPSNNALLWGARGTGKSSLVKACLRELTGEFPHLKLVEVHREDVMDLPSIMSMLQAAAEYRFILFCDDLSFEARETTYKAMKVALDGGIQGRPKNVVFYATSNRRHLVPRDMIENEKATAINPGDAVEESVSLSDRFGLWLGFHRHSQDIYMQMIRAYAAYYGLDVTEEEWRPDAVEWAATRGDRSGRVAWQFFQDLAARHGIQLN